MPSPLKPPALKAGAVVRVISPSSPVDEGALEAGRKELARLGFEPVVADGARARHGFFAGSHASRWEGLTGAFGDKSVNGVWCSRGGYGATYLLDRVDATMFASPRVFVGYSDATALQSFLWQKLNWVTFHGPMVAAGLDKGAAGSDEESLLAAVRNTSGGWRVNLHGEPLAEGIAEGVLLGGCLTVLQTTLGTPWELDTRGAILVLEDRAMRPFQVDRALMHLRQAGKLRELHGIIFGEFPECEPPGESENVQSIASRFARDSGIPVVWGAAVGHTPRPMLTLPLGVRARLEAGAGGAKTDLHILEAAVT
ncbi:MAG: S66 peptidase family protein [Candidatus Acidiferrales bacterium]